MFQLIESSSGQLLNHMWGTSSTSAHFWEKCALALDVIIIEPCDISSTSAHFWEKCALVLDVMITEPCSGTSSTSAQFWEKCALVLYVMIIEPCLRYIKYKCTILGKMCTCTWCDDYWTMWHISSTSAHFWGKCALVLDWWLLNHVWVHQVQAHNFGKNLHLYLMWWLLNQVWGTSSTSAHLGSQNVYNSVRTWVQMKLYLQYYIH